MPDFQSVPDGFELQSEPVIGIAKHTVFVLHGMWSISNWYNDYNRAVTGKVATVAYKFVPISYRFPSKMQFLSGLGSSERCEIVEGRIKHAIEMEPSDSFSIICHSFGTKVFSGLSTELKSRFDWVFFAGSICLLNDELYLRACAGNLVNDCGGLDLLPALAEAVRPSIYGQTGVVGFGNHPINDRFFCIGHSGAVSQTHFRDWIFPVLETSQVECVEQYRAGKFRLALPWAIRILILSGIVLATICWLLF